MKLHEQQLLEAILVAHQRTSIEGCHCGWGKLGESHAAHVVACYVAALGGAS